MSTSEPNLEKEIPRDEPSRTETVLVKGIPDDELAWTEPNIEGGISEDEPKWTEANLEEKFPRINRLGPRQFSWKKVQRINFYFV
ncbi:hypothetical protein V3C99_017428 [Haemonchus contortus]|uniref:INCENP_ARK-bind domain-containing protein n=1 Tax=Haemonchus contortus TaxID=6289 RepID=A0A7I4Z7V3_HAECO